ncbi:MAG TPA: hypothetical protein VMN04_04080 [Thermoanaerobaculia bacterium]|nr:hypothetical protein [Thermoanaerobaculia bacterium]
MKSSKRFPPLLAAAATLVFVGCAKAEAPPVKVASHACMGPATTVTVFVDSDGKTNNKVVYVCEGKDSVDWVAADEKAFVSDDIGWKNGESPFSERPAHVTHGNRKVLHSKPPKAGTARHSFDYDAWLVLPDGSKIKIDPRIEVMD